MVDIDRFAHSLDGQHVPQEAAQCRVIRNAPQVALEQPVIGRVEADQRHEEPDVGLGEGLAQKEGPIRRKARL